MEVPFRSDPGPDDQAADPQRQVPRLPRATPPHVWLAPPRAQREEPLAHPGRGPARAPTRARAALTPRRPRRARPRRQPSTREAGEHRFRISRGGGIPPAKKEERQPSDVPDARYMDSPISRNVKWVGVTPNCGDPKLREAVPRVSHEDQMLMPQRLMGRCLA